MVRIGDLHLGWVFDCMDQQLFNVVRKPAVAGLLGVRHDSPNVDKFGGIATVADINRLGHGRNHFRHTGR